MPESVELNGMTINLVENKAAYDDMTKNPNEMYLVEKEYELEFNVITVYNPTTGKMETNVELVSGNIKDVFTKLLNSNSDYSPQAKFNTTFIYFDTIHNGCFILDPVISEFSDTIYPYNKQLVYITNNYPPSYPDSVVYDKLLVRFNICFFISDGRVFSDGDIVGFFSNGLFGVGDNDYFYWYANNKGVLLDHFTD